MKNTDDEIHIISTVMYCLCVMHLPLGYDLYKGTDKVEN